MAKAKKLTAAEVWSAFCALDDSDQQDIVDRLDPGQLIKNPYVAMYLNGDEIALQAERDKRPRNRPTSKRTQRIEMIGRLRDVDKLSFAQIGKRSTVRALYKDGTKPMPRQRVSDDYDEYKKGSRPQI